MDADAAVAVVLGMFPGATVLPHDYGPPGPAPERPPRGLDMSRLTLRGPCPGCGQETACGWVERAPGGGWREIRSDPTPCLDCRERHSFAGEPVWAVGPRVVLTDESARLEGGYAAPWWAARAGEWAAPQNAPCVPPPLAPERPPGPAGATGHPPAAAAVLGPRGAAPGPLPASASPVEIRGGALYVNGAAVAEGIDPAAVVVLGRRVCVGGRQVATLTQPSEGN